MRIGNVQLHLLYRRLYYIPIIYAAWVFGKRGGVLAALGAAVPFAIHAQVALNGPLGMGFDNALEILSFFAAGLLFGAVRDVEERKTAGPPTGFDAARGGLPEARGARDPADQRAGLHVVDPALDHLGRAHGRTRRRRLRQRTLLRNACCPCRSSRWSQSRSAPCSQTTAACPATWPRCSRAGFRSR